MITRRSVAFGGGAGAFAMAARPAIAEARAIEVWSLESPGDGNVVARAIAHVVKGFEAVHPGVELKITSMPWQQLSPTLLRASRARRVPDVAMFYSPDLPVQIDARTVMPLTGFMTDWPEDKRADILRLRQAQDAAGVIYGLPWQVRTSGLFYRADLLEKVGRQPPRTLAEWSDAAAAAQGGDVVGMALGFNPGAASVAAGWFLTTQLGLGAGVLKADGSPDFASPQAERIVQWVFEQVHGRNPPTLPLDVALQDGEKEHDLFSARRLVFLPSSSDRHPRLLAQSGLPFEAIGMTRYPTDDAAVPAPALVQSWNLTIPIGAKSPDLAWEFIDHWTSTAEQVEGCRIAGFVPARRSALQDPFFDAPQARIIRFATEYAADHPMHFDFPVNTSALYDTWVRMFGRVLNQELDARGGLQWAEADYAQRRRG
jgi:multiple sugar transport system substrate-binding protein